MSRRWSKDDQDRKMLNSANKLMVLQIIRCYSTASYTASFMLTGTTPKNLLAKENVKFTTRAQTILEPPTILRDIKNEKRIVAIAQWNDIFLNANTREWTRRILLSITK